MLLRNRFTWIGHILPDLLGSVLATYHIGASLHIRISVNMKTMEDSVLPELSNNLNIGLMIIICHTFHCPL